MYIALLPWRGDIFCRVRVQHLYLLKNRYMSIKNVQSITLFFKIQSIGTIKCNPSNLYLFSIITPNVYYRATTYPELVLFQNITSKIKFIAMTQCSTMQ